MIKLVVIGSTGKMGKRILSLIEKDPSLTLAASAHRGSPLEEAIAQGDAVIDFSLPEGTEQALRAALKQKKPLIIGTTGLRERQNEEIRNASKIIPIVYASNMSLGINLLWNLIEKAAKVLPKDFQVQVTETHHIHKKDKPSGTAKTIGKILEGVRGGKISIESIREGEVIGDHKILFSSSLEDLEIFHHAKDRDIFAKGAVAAARWIIGKKPGLYSMKDVLGLTQ